MNEVTLRHGSAVHPELFPVMRTLDEVKTECQARADRNAYPLAGLVPAEVREALARLTSIGDRYMSAGEALGRGTPQAREKFLAAWRYYSFARWPVPLSAGKERAYGKAILAFLAAAESLDPKIEAVRIPFEGSEIVGYLRLPKGAHGPVPVIIAIGGLDSRKEDMVERFSASASISRVRVKRRFRSRRAPSACSRARSIIYANVRTSTPRRSPCTAAASARIGRRSLP